MLRGFEEVERNLEQWHGQVFERCVQVMEEIGAVLEGYAKTHHEWTPRTGLTDVSTRGFIAEVTPVMIRTVLTATMEYDVFLELARDGKWAWLWPAVEANKDLIREKIRSIVQ